MKPPTDEELELLWRQSDERDYHFGPRTIRALIQEVRRLREQRELVTDIVKAATQRSDELEAEVKRLKGLLEQWDAYATKLGASRDMWKRRAKS